MPPKKPAKPNGFSMFAQNLMSKQGRKYKSMKEACEAAGPLWHGLSQKERETWTTMAKQAKAEEAPGRYTSEGLSVEELTREQRMEMERDEKMKQEIRQCMVVAKTKFKGIQGLAEELFFVIHMNVFCYHMAEETYYPAEIGVLGFSLKSGVRQENIFHQFIQPGPLPFGYKFEAKQISDETHKIKVRYSDAEDNNMAEVFQNLNTFLEKKKPPGVKRMPILYAEEKNLSMIRQILNQWCMDFTENEENLFRVYSLPMMFMYLKNTAAGDEAFPTITIPQRELEKDIYAYNTEICCEYHATSSRPECCSKSVVCRYAFVICDCCCYHVGVNMEPGFHVPIQSDIPNHLSTRSSVTSFATNSSRSSKVGNRRQKGNESDVDSESTTNETWDTQSLISDTTTTATTINTTADDFPALGSSGTGAQLKNISSSTNRSYAGAIGETNFSSSSGPTLPTGFSSSLNNMSLIQRSAGRGFRPKNKPSGDDSGSEAAPSGYASSSDGDFPPIGRGKGRGFIGRLGPRKPGLPQ